MTLPQDFLDDPAGFARINVLALYVLGGGLRKDGQKADVKYWGLTAAHAPNAVENKEHGKAYLLRVVPEDSDGAFAGYYCPYANNDWQPSMLGNKASSCSRTRWTAARLVLAAREMGPMAMFWSVM
jgi:hypothetical protein